MIRAEDWKLIEVFETGELTLDDLADDVGETNDLSDQETTRTVQLHTKLKQWRAKVVTEPMKPNPEYEEAGEWEYDRSMSQRLR